MCLGSGFPYLGSRTILQAIGRVLSSPMALRMACCCTGVGLTPDMQVCIQGPSNDGSTRGWHLMCTSRATSKTRQQGSSTVQHTPSIPCCTCTWHEQNQCLDFVFAKAREAAEAPRLHRRPAAGPAASHNLRMASDGDTPPTLSMFRLRLWISWHAQQKRAGKAHYPSHTFLPSSNIGSTERI